MRVNDPRGLIGVNSASQDRAKFCTAVGDAQLVEEGPPAVQVVGPLELSKLVTVAFRWKFSL